MSEHLEIYINRKYKEYITSDNLNYIEVYQLYYQEIIPESLSYLFGYFHFSFNRLFDYLNEKKNKNNHYNSKESNELIDLVKDVKSLQRELENSKFSFIIKSEYEQYILQCEKFLVSSGGSAIPEELEDIITFETQPIFKINSSIEINKTIVNLKLIGEGSYATVAKYKDKEYDKIFAIKKAKSNLTQKV